MAERKPTMKEIVTKEVAEVLMNAWGLAELPLSREGLLLEKDGEQLVVNIVHKKKRLGEEDIRDIFTPDSFTDEPLTEDAVDEDEDY